VLKTTLPQELNLHTLNITLSIAYRRSTHSTDPVTSS